jgi:hypothetical protein
MKKPKLTPPKLDPKDAAAINRNLVKQSDTYKKAIKDEAKKAPDAPKFAPGSEKKPYTGR